ncbi:hypothetical protein E1B28_008509 [Marasmius oreades]|uniref:Uncharacterized protein n=1 Tax=Marasmius oreades TaxID=181124 RepID=A0A9P7USG5_9AGAR|nr:uncharacterized protein E1B28_008509 [Marasmius oreades]KAG7092135.1 hypothetical protein E1B28_008509 [Marasmius oreades]
MKPLVTRKRAGSEINDGGINGSKRPKGNSIGGLIPDFRLKLHPKPAKSKASPQCPDSESDREMDIADGIGALAEEWSVEDLKAARHAKSKKHGSTNKRAMIDARLTLEEESKIKLVPANVNQIDIKEQRESARGSKARYRDINRERP